MSVLIRGMSGYECCADCEFCGGLIIPDGIYVCDCPQTRGMNITKAIEEDCKSSDCQLVELPEKHGRLVDADALIAKYGDWYTEEGTEEGFIGTLEMLLKDTPTVVEAEGEDT